ncbi:azurin [Balneola vulgaris]|jgi:azurin|uniref:azurin n=1 Tax=Balneola vulgaris TaxID=287535 RepID=UPI000370CF71|nr:azurin [Balneola vulgaris]
MNVLITLLTVLFLANPVAPNTDSEIKTTQENNTITEVVIESNDKMRFNLKEIKVKAGTTVKLTLKHVGKLPKQAMGHNFVLLKQGVELRDFAMEATKFKANDYIPENTNDTIAYTDLIGGGESTTIEFEAPEKGTYTFLCSFPGHFGLMKGTFVVE